MKKCPYCAEEWRKRFKERGTLCYNYRYKEVNI